MTARGAAAALHRARLSDREALLFEAGIKLGGIFHQYLGTPVAPRTAPRLARAIESAVALQPFVASVRVQIDPSRGGRSGRGRFGYRYLTAEMLGASVTIADGPTSVTATLALRPRIRYPLMRVERIGGPAAPTSAARSVRRRGRPARRSRSSAG